MKIEIIGTGCHNCIELDPRVAQVVSSLRLKNVEIEGVDDERRIRRYMSPRPFQAWLSMACW